jgi:hypothetical protein
MKTQYYDVLMTHPNPLAFGKAFAEGSKSWSSVTFAKAFADTFGVVRDELGALDTKFGAQYWLRLLESGTFLRPIRCREAATNRSISTSGVVHAYSSLKLKNGAIGDVFQFLIILSFVCL